MRDRRRVSDFKLLTEWRKFVTTERAVYFDGTPVIFNGSFPVSDYIPTAKAEKLVQRELLIERNLQFRCKPPNPKWVIYYADLFQTKKRLYSRYFHVDFIPYLNSLKPNKIGFRDNRLCVYCNRIINHCKANPCDDRVYAKMTPAERHEKYVREREKARRRKLAFSFWATFGIETGESGR